MSDTLICCITQMGGARVVPKPQYIGMRLSRGPFSMVPVVGGSAHFFKTYVLGSETSQKHRFFDISALGKITKNDGFLRFLPPKPRD